MNCINIKNYLIILKAANELVVDASQKKQESQESQESQKNQKNQEKQENQGVN